MVLSIYIISLHVVWFLLCHELLTMTYSVCRCYSVVSLIMHLNLIGMRFDARDQRTKLYRPIH